MNEPERFESTLMSARAGSGFVFHRGRQLKIGALPNRSSAGDSVIYKIINEHGTEEAIYIGPSPSP
jgi:hypothetical protein